MLGAMMTKTKLVVSLAGCLVAGGIAIACCSPGKDARPSVRLLERLKADGRAKKGEAAAAAIARVVAANAGLLKAAVPGVDDLKARAKDLSKRIGAPGRKEKYLLPAETEDLRLLAFDYMKLTKLLDRVAQDGQECPEMEDVEPRVRTLGTATRLAAGLEQQDLSRVFVAAFDDLPLARDQLDRPLPKDNVPPRLYRRIRDASRSLRARVALREAIDRFQAAEVQRLILDDKEGGDLRWCAKRIYASPSYDELRKDEEVGRVVARAPEKIEEAAGEASIAVESAMYPAQIFVSSLIGDAVTSTRGPRITPEMVEKTRRTIVKPGDIILERCDFYLSNAFLPGWWGHAAMYVGDRADMERLGLAADPLVSPHLAALADGHDLVESISEGVVVSSLAHVMRADHIAVLRPRYKDEGALKKALRGTFAHVGKPYDFRFDFESDQELVCSELCWRALEGVLNVTLTRRMGRFTWIPDEVAAMAIGPNAQLEYVAFIKDGKDATLADYEAVLK